MSQLFAMGRITTDLELKTSTRHNSYVHFSLMERINFGENARNQFIQVWAWGNLAQQLMQLGVKAGSLVWVSGSLELEDYVKKDGKTRDKQLKLKLRDWGFVSRDKTPKKQKGTRISHDSSAAPVGVIDGDRETLPE